MNNLINSLINNIKKLKENINKISTPYETINNKYRSDEISLINGENLQYNEKINRISELLIQDITRSRNCIKAFSLNNEINLINDTSINTTSNEEKTITLNLLDKTIARIIHESSLFHKKDYEILFGCLSITSSNSLNPEQQNLQIIPIYNEYFAATPSTFASSIFSNIQCKCIHNKELRSEEQINLEIKYKLKENLSEDTIILNGAILMTSEIGRRGSFDANELDYEV